VIAWALALATLALGLTAATPAVSTAAEMMSAAHASIRATDAGRHVGVLADDSFEGREGGSRGGRAAATYIVEQLTKLGIPPAGDAGTYYQPFGGMRNILALIEGSDPELAKEVIVIGAHYDHVGYGNADNSYGPFGYVHNNQVSNVAIISYCLDTSKNQPTGTINFSRLDTYRLVTPVQLTNGLLALTNPAVANPYLYAVNYNVLRIQNGLGSLLYAN
jgi:hypothetical protein